MESIIEVIRLLHDSNARHRRKGFRYCENTTTDMLKHAAEELMELVEADTVYQIRLGQDKSQIREELADLLMILLHFADTHQITSQALQNSMFDKFLKRFTLSRKERATIVRLKKRLNLRRTRKLRLFGGDEVD